MDGIRQPDVRSCRRRFLRACAGVLPVLVMPGRILDGAEASAGSRALKFIHTHTDERLTVEYFSAGRYVPDALAAIDHLLRDFRTDEVHVIERPVLDLLHDLMNVTGAARPLQVISAYRSPRTNAALRERSEAVAAGSLHMVGKAIDIRVADVPLSRLRSAALALRRGGVGYYAASDFVHVDVGRVRTW